MNLDFLIAINKTANKHRRVLLWCKKLISNLYRHAFGKDLMFFCVIWINLLSIHKIGDNFLWFEQKFSELAGLGEISI